MMIDRQYVLMFIDKNRQKNNIVMTKSQEGSALEVQDTFQDQDLYDFNFNILLFILRFNLAKLSDF